MTKDSGLRIRVQRDLHDKFIGVCRVQVRPAAEVLLDFMRVYLSRHESVQRVHECWVS
jgi:hypothetical protein